MLIEADGLDEIEFAGKSFKFAETAPEMPLTGDSCLFRPGENKKNAQSVV